MRITKPFIHLDEIDIKNRPDLRLEDLNFEQVKKGRYLVSNYGDLYSLYTSKFLRPQYDKDGYNKIELATDYGHKKVFVHRAVAYTYVDNPNPEEFNIVNHKDGIKSNNYYQNLEHCTEDYNRQHAIEHNLTCYGERSQSSKFSQNDVIAICKLFEQGYTPVDIKNSYHIDGMSSKAVYDFARNVYNKRTWTRVSRDYNF